MQKRNHIFFSGNIQGIGFRFGALNLARRYMIKGWVKNLSDGRVEMVAEGENRDLDSFLSDLNSEFKENIVDCEVTVEETAEGLGDFQITF